MVQVKFCGLPVQEYWFFCIYTRILQALSWTFTGNRFRRQGLNGKMIAAAADFARRHGATVLEAYPVEPKQADMPAVFAWTGIAAPFLRAGFREVARRSENRPVLRLELG